jgi:hypothetical protein
MQRLSSVDAGRVSSNSCNASATPSQLEVKRRQIDHLVLIRMRDFKVTSLPIIGTTDGLNSLYVK